MNIKELKEFLNKFPEETEIHLIQPDHGGYDAEIQQVVTSDLELASDKEAGSIFISTKKSSWKKLSFYENCNL